MPVPTLAAGSKPGAENCENAEELGHAMQSVELEMPEISSEMQRCFARLREEFHMDFVRLEARVKVVETHLDLGEKYTPEAVGLVCDNAQLGVVQDEKVPPEGAKPLSFWGPVPSAEESVDSASLESTEVCFEESVWCMPLVIGLADAGKFDRVFAVLLVFLNLGMQTAFSWVLLSDSFMGAAFDSNIDHAKKWRTSVAHDYKFIDLADTSLVSRVCSGDGALILSTTQANLINHINSFLGLKDGSLQAPFFRPGVLLCTVCIILWTLCVYKEFRSIWLQMEAAMTIPKRSTTKVRNHTFLSMSYGRFLLLLTTYIARTAIATVLLVAGVLWLARTTSIEELMLNAVALNAILDVDEFLFAGMLPLRYQHAIRRLDPIKVSYSHGRSQAESFLHFLSLGSLVLASYFLLIGPLSETMLTVIREMCGGTQNFAVSYNSNTQRPYGVMTEIPGSARNLTHTELAVESHKATSPETTPPTSGSPYLVMSSSKDLFKERVERSMRDESTLRPFCIEEFLYLRDTPPTADQLVHLNNAAASMGRVGVQSCSELKTLCSSHDARGIRLTCGVTCGCTSPYSNPWYKVGSQGCGAACLQMAQLQTNRTCQDQPGPHWADFWNDYLDVMSAAYGRDMRQTAFFSDMAALIQAMLTGGCSALMQFPAEVLTGASWCAGNEELFRGLAYLCPQTCGCNQTSGGALPSYCPASCSSPP